MREIVRLSVADEATLLHHFSQGPAQPLVLTDATAQWPARQRWTFDFFAGEYGDQLGVIQRRFGGGMDGKATTLGQYIAGMDKPLEETAGFWVDCHGLPVGAPQGDAAGQPWGFLWRAFDVAPELRADISPYPLAIPNIVAGLDRDMLKLLEDLSGFEFSSLYIGRAGTVTPLHSDHNHSLGSLAQFAGDKLVMLYDPVDVGDQLVFGFNPEQADFSAFPTMRGLVGYSTVLQPDEMVIIPPRWPHYTRALDHSITVSHNFFNQFNFSAYLRGQLQDVLRRDQGAALCRAIGKRLGVPDSAASA